MSVQQVFNAANNCKHNALKLRDMARNEPNNNAKKLLLEAAHHLEVGTAELDYILTSSTVSI